MGKNVYYQNKNLSATVYPYSFISHAFASCSSWNVLLLYITISLHLFRNHIETSDLKSKKECATSTTDSKVNQKIPALASSSDAWVRQLNHGWTAIRSPKNVEAQIILEAFQAGLFPDTSKSSSRTHNRTGSLLEWTNHGITFSNIYNNVWV